MADYYDPWALNYEQLMRAQPVANTGPINDAAPESPYSMQWANGFPVFRPEDFTKFDNDYDTYNAAQHEGSVPSYQDQFYGFSATSPWAIDSQSPFYTGNKYANYTNNGQNVAIGSRPTTSSWDIQFNPDGSPISVKQKSGRSEGLVQPYSLVNGRYAPVGDSNQVQWKTNASHSDTIAMIATALAGAGAAAGAAGGAAAGAGGTTGAGGAAGAGAGGASGGTAGLSAGEVAAGGGVGAGGGAAVGGGSGAGAGSGGLLGGVSTSDWMKLGSAGLGALAGASGAGPQTATTSQSLPPELQALLNNLIPKVQQTSPVLGAATNQLQDTIQGKYLNSNPYLENAVKQQQDQMQNRFGTTLMGSGSFGNANVAEQGFKAMNDSANNMRFQNYEQERNRQMQATGQAPNFNIAPYAPAFSLLGLGGRNTTQTSPGMSTGAGLLGGALMGGQLYNTWFPKANNGYSRTGNYSVDNQEIF